MRTASFFRFGWPFCGLMGALASLALVWHYNGIVPLPGAYDSLLYLRLAESLLEGHWLGAYDHMTLIRMPGYPLLLAFNSLSGFPLHLSQHGFYLIALALLAAGLVANGLSHFWACLFFLIGAFHPVAISPACYVATEGVYVTQTTLVLAGCLGVLGTLDQRLLRYIGWVLLLGVSLLLFWHTRSERIWILPLMGIWVLLLVVRGYRLGLRGIARGGVAVVIPLVMTVGAAEWLIERNHRAYGMAVTSELSESNFKNAFRQLTRLAPETHRPHVPVTRAAMVTAAKISPAFSRLEPLLAEQTNGQGWARWGCEWMGICDELAGGWMVWAVREAAASQGVHANAIDASRFYGTMATEVESACKQKTVACSNNLTGNMMAPPFQVHDLPRMLFSLWRIARMTVGFGELRTPAAMTKPPLPAPELAQRYQRVVHDPGKGWGFLGGPYFHAFIVVYFWLQILGCALMAVAAGGWVWSLTIPDRGAMVMHRYSLGFVVICLIVVMASRLFIIAYLDAMSFHAQLRYMVMVYPAFMALLVVISALGVERWRLCRRPLHDSG